MDPVDEELSQRDAVLLDAIARIDGVDDVSGPLTQVLLLGCIAQRLGGTLKFDTETKKITNSRKANKLLKGHKPRKGWEEYYKLI